MKKRWALFCLTILVCVLCSSCWDNREINELGLVTAVGIDKGEGENRYIITAQIANPSSGGSSQSGGAAKASEWIGTAQGESLFDAVRALGDISSKRIMWAHDGVVVIGESLASESIVPVVDFFTHNPELRMKTAVVVSKGDAKPYISANVGMDTPSGISFISLQGHRRLTAKSVESNMLEVSAHLKDPINNPLIAGIDLKEVTMKTKDGETKINTMQTISLSGAAVFKGIRMVGWLTPEEARGASWVLNQTKSTLVTVQVPAYDNKSVSVEIHQIKANIKSKVINGLPHFTIEVKGNAEIVEEDGTTNLDITNAKKQVSNLVNKKIQEEIKNMLSVVQKKYGVDVLEFSDITHAQNPKEWKNGIKYKWEEIFPQIPMTVSVNITINGSTLNQIPMNID